MGSGTWFMGYGQSPEDGAMSLINCCAQKSLQSGDCLEPSGFANMTGLPAHFYPEKEGASGPSVREMLWEESEKAVGKWDL